MFSKIYIYFFLTLKSNEYNYSNIILTRFATTIYFLIIILNMAMNLSTDCCFYIKHMFRIKKWKVIKLTIVIAFNFL